jgi:hypothetical protein
MADSPYDGITRAPPPPPHHLAINGPDLSHLTPEERAIIQGVMQKQQVSQPRADNFSMILDGLLSRRRRAGRSNS